MISIIVGTVVIVFFIIIGLLIVKTCKCGACGDCNSEKCTSCKHFAAPKQNTNYKPKYEEHQISKEILKKFEGLSDADKGKIVDYWNDHIAPQLDNLADNINRLSDDDFWKLCRKVNVRENHGNEN